MSDTPNQGQGSQGAWPPAEGSQPDPQPWSTPSANPPADTADDSASSAPAETWGQQPSTWDSGSTDPAASAASASDPGASWGSSAGAADWGSAAGSSTDQQWSSASTESSWGQAPSAPQDQPAPTQPADPNAWGQASAQSQPSADAWGQQSAQPTQSQPSADPNAWGQAPGASAPSASQPSAPGYGYPPQDPTPYPQQSAPETQGYGQPAAGYGQPAAGYGQPAAGYGQPYGQQSAPQPDYGTGQQQSWGGAPQDPQQSWQVQPTGAAPYGGPGGFPGGGAPVVDDPTKPSMYQPNQPPPTPGAQPVSPSDEKTWATLTHVGMIVTGFVAPLIIYVIYKDRSRWITLHAKESLNLGILVTIVYFISALLSGFGVGIITYLAMGVIALIFGILGAMAANRGEYKPYPFNLRLIK